jgi:hypothetical protein
MLREAEKQKNGKGRRGTLQQPTQQQPDRPQTLRKKRKAKFTEETERQGEQRNLLSDNSLALSNC